jgi:hypothetical protein
LAGALKARYLAFERRSNWPGAIAFLIRHDGCGNHLLAEFPASHNSWFFFSGSWELLNLNFGVRNYYASASILAQAATQVSFLTGGFFQASIVIPAPKIA